MAGKKEDGGYTLKLTGPGHTFEQEVEKDVATKIITFVMGGELSDGSKGGNAGGGGQAGSSGNLNVTPAGTPTPKQFMAQKKPASNYERVACLGYYLANYREMPHFKTSEITKLNTESAHNFTNAALFVRHATSTYHFLSGVGGGKKQLTVLGESLVEALPDRAKVAEALAEHRPARKKTKRKKA